jgi:hypothetical protein
MPKLKQYIALDTTFAHPAIFMLQAKDIDHAIEVYCLSQCLRAKKFRNGRWRWGAEYYTSARELLASMVDVSFEIGLLAEPKTSACDEVFAGIDWWSLIYGWENHDFYMRPMQKLGKFYEWYSRDRTYYAIFPSPDFIMKSLRKKFGDAFRSRTLRPRAKRGERAGRTGPGKSV